MIHRSGMQGHGGACLGLMVCASSGITPVQVPARSKQSKACWSHMRSHESTADTEAVKGIVLWKVQENHIQDFPILNWLFSYWFKDWILRDLNVGVFQIPQGKQREENTQASLLCIMVFIISLLCGCCSF